MTLTRTLSSLRTTHRQPCPPAAARLPAAVLAVAGVLFAAGSSALPARAQQPATPELKPNPIESLRAFEPSRNEAYQLGRGDEISIDFGARPELNAKRIIGPDGRVTLPLAGSVELADKTREQAADIVVAALTPFYSHLTATVGVDRYTSNRVLLLGAVEHPGVINFDQPPTLLELLTRGGGLLAANPGGLSAASDSFTSLQAGNRARPTPPVPERCAIYRGSDQVLWVDLKGLLDSGSPLADLRLRRDDVVYVPSASERYVSVLGQVQHPGALQLDNSTTLAKLLAEAGGLTPQAGHLPDIQVIQPSTGVTRIINLKAILSPAKLDLTLRSGDVIFVPESGFNRATYVIERLSPLVTVFTAAALFNR